MQQSNVIFAALLMGYILFITNRGELPTYIALLRGGGQEAQTSSGTSSSGNPLTGLLDPGQIDNGDGTLTNLLPQSLTSSAP